VLGVVLLPITVYLGYQEFQRSRIERARKVLRTSHYPTERADALAEIAFAGPAGRFALPELILLLSQKKDPAVVAILRDLGPAAEDAIPALMLRLDDDADGKIRETLIAIDPAWRNRPEAIHAAHALIGRAVTTDNMGKLLGPREDRIRAAVAIHRLVGDNPAQARLILGQLPLVIEKRSPVLMSVKLTANAGLLIHVLVEQLESDYRDTALFLLPILDPAWATSARAKQAQPDLIAQYLERGPNVHLNSPVRAAASERIARWVPEEVAVEGCLHAWDLRERNVAAIELLQHYPASARARVISAILQWGGWANPDSQAGWMLSVPNALYCLRELDPDWVRHSRAVNAIPQLILRAVHGYADERKEALEILDQIDPRWDRHPQAKLAVPFLAKELRTERIRQLRYYEEQIRPITNAAEMLERLGPVAKEAIPALLVARAHGFPEDIRKYSVKMMELGAQVDAILKRFPDAIDLDWATGPDALPAIPELLGVLEKNPGGAAELLGEFGPAARCALPALRAARKKLGDADRDAAAAINKAIARIGAGP
jgi:hypothetical protein